MRVNKVYALFLLPLFLMSCGNFYMIEQKTRPEIKADMENATLVIYRGTNFGFAVTIDNFVDKQFVGQTKGKSYFIAKVSPGEHYVIGASENNCCAKITFEAGKVYYLLQGIYPGVMFARTGYAGSDPESFEKDVSDLAYFVYDTGKGAPTLEEDTYKQTIADHEKESQEEPDRHKDTANLKGY